MAYWCFSDNNLIDSINITSFKYKIFSILLSTNSKY